MASLISGCGSNREEKPDLPKSISPGWQLWSLDHKPVPADVTLSGSPYCWLAEYGGQGMATVWLCHYNAEAAAFDAMQRARTGAHTVKFQEGGYLVLVRWDDSPKTSITALVRAIQNVVQPK